MPEQGGQGIGQLLRFATLAPQEALAQLGVSFEGLTVHEAAARLKRDGPNLLPEPGQRPLWQQLLGQFTHFFAVTLWVASLLAFIGQMPELGWAIVAVVVINGVFSFVQEYRAERATRALAALLPANAVVRRAGQRTVVRAAELVVGDLLVLEEGARISADARVLRSVGLKVDNSTLTGESEPVPRTADTPSAPPADEVDCPNLVFAGTWVASGSALALVVATGEATRLGSITELTGTVVRRPTPLHAGMNRAVRVIGAVALAAGLLFFGVSSWLGMPPHAGLLFTVGVVVALVPEGLLPTLSLALAMGATRMAHRGALVRHLEAVETLGSTTVICTDKTGTLTANQMTVTALWGPAGLLNVTGVGYGPSGTLLSGDRPLGPDELRPLEPLLTAAALCGDARVERHEGHWRCLGDPTEGALVVLARKGGVERTAAERHAPRRREFPFESSRRRMSTVHALPSGEFLVLAKGSPEVLLPLCRTRWDGTRAVPLGDEERARSEELADALAARGLRVLALARRVVPAPAPQTPDDAEQALELLGLVGMADPVRPEVPPAVARCREAGIRVLIITGDHPATAAAVARQVGLSDAGVRLGHELPAEDAALGELLAGPVTLLARVAPEQKLRIARALQARGDVVAMTGDGVNDAPALRQADIGVAMGASGTDVAREAADLVLLDDNFSHVVEAVEEGRAAFANIRRFLTYHLTDNVAELAPFVLWALSGGRFPLLISVLQVLALDIGTDLLPALALGAEPPEPGVMRERPRPRRTPLLDRRVLGRAFGFLGPVQAATSLTFAPLGAALFLGWSPGTPLPGAPDARALLSTLVFTSIVLMQAANALECRSTPASLFSVGIRSNRLLAGAIVVEVLMLLCFVYAPAVRHLLGNRPLGLAQWGLLLAAPGVLLVAEESRKAVVRAWARRRAGA